MSSRTAPQALTPSIPSLRLAHLARLLLVAVLLGGFLYYVALSLHWPLLLDSPIMHFVRFMMDHGFRPYIDITDNNMPGAYLTEGWAMRIFGGTDLGWRIYDFTLLLSITASAIVIALPTDWLAGVWTGGLFALLHASEGPLYAGEREELMSALLLAACAAAFLAVRHRRPWLLACSGLLSGLACSIKPTVTPLALLFLAFGVWRLRRAGARWVAAIAWSAAGFGAVILLALGFLVRFHAFAAFRFIVQTIVPAYVALNRPSFGQLLHQMVPLNLLLLLPFALAVFLLEQVWTAEKTVLLLAAAGGALSYLAQQKGFFHHRYLLVVFLLLLTGLEITPAILRKGWSHRVALAAFALVLCISVPHYLKLLRGLPPHHELTPTLEADLASLGSNAHLQHQVQCFDLVFGCLNALYHMQVVENTGFTGDLLLLAPGQTKPSLFYRDMFWRLNQQRPASVYVVTNEWFGHDDSFAKLDTWPAFHTYLQENFTLVRERTFPLENQTVADPNPAHVVPAYRIYVRNGSELLRDRPQTPPLAALPRNSSPAALPYTAR